MKTSVHDSSGLPLADAREMPRVRPPRWMHHSVTATLLLLLAIGTIVLFMPVEETIPTKGRLYNREAVSLYAPRECFISSNPPPVGTFTQQGGLLLNLCDHDLDAQRTAFDAEIVTARAILALEEARAGRIIAAPVPTEFLFSPFDVSRYEEITDLQEAFLKRLEIIEKSGAASQAEVLQLRLQLINNETLLRRSRLGKELLEGPYGNAARDEAKMAIETAKARLAGLEARKRHLENLHESLQIRAPVSGILTAVTRRDPGERIAAGEKIFEISKGTAMYIRLNAPVDRFHRIREGLFVRFRAESESDSLAPPGRAIVRYTNRSPYNNSDIHPTDKRAELPGNSFDAEVLSAPSELLPDVPVSAEIILGARPFWQLLSEQGS